MPTLIENLQNKNYHPMIQNHLNQFGLPVLFVILVFFFYPGFSQFQTNSDEGINLMKAMLVDNGYTLYDQIWSDQPPIFTHLLALGFRFFGYHVGFSRLIVLALSAVLLWAGGRYLKLVWGKEASIMGMILLMLLPGYLTLSASVMIGLPSISFAMVALWSLAEWHHNRKYHWLGISALFLGLSVLTKIFLGILGPIFCLGILVGEYFYAEKKIKPSIFLPALMYGILFSLILIFTSVFWVGIENLDQLWLSHVKATDLEVFDYTYKINAYLRNTNMLAYVVMGLIGIWSVAKEKKWLGLYASVWAISAYIFFLNHYPVWDHHVLYISIPLALTAAGPAVREFQRLLKAFWQKVSKGFSSALQVVVIIALLTVLFPFQLSGNIQKLNLTSPWNPDLGLGNWNQKMMDHMSLYQAQTNWIVTDVPMYAFRKSLLVPPELAVFSGKRLGTGEITDEDIINVIETYQPEQVMMSRFELSTYLPELEEYLEQNYVLIYNRGKNKLYLRSDIEIKPLN